MVRYLKVVCTEKLWRTTLAFISLTATFDEFKMAIFRIYPGASGDRTYTTQDLDVLVGEHVWVGIFTGNELGDYFQQFLLITRYLISKDRMAVTKQSQTFLRGFRQDLSNRVMQRLQLKRPDHMPQDLYDLDDIYDVTNFVLMGTTLDPQIGTPQLNINQYPALAQSPPAQAVQDANSMKIEALTTAIASLGEMFKMVFKVQQAGGKPMNVAPQPAGGSASICNFCGGAGHFIRECKVVAEYNRASKCKRNHKGKVVLPSGVMVPRGVPGNWLRDHVDEWHQMNPGQMALQMILEVVAAQPTTALASESASQSSAGYPAQYAGQCLEVSQPGLYALRRLPGLRPDVATVPHPLRENTATAPGGGSGGGNRTTTSPFKRELPLHKRKDTLAAKKGKTPEIQEIPDTEHPYGATRQEGPGKPANPVLRWNNQAYTTTTKLMITRSCRKSINVQWTSRSQ